MNLIVGERLRQGRLLLAITIAQAAKLLGVSQGELDAVEGGFKNRNRAIPHQLIYNASFVYDISIDFIYAAGGADGDEWERAEDVRCERDLLSHLSMLYLSEAAQNAKALQRQDKRLKEVEWSVAALVSANQGVNARFGRFLELNPEFIDAAASNNLLKSIEHAEIVANAAICKLVKCKTLPFECINPQPEPAALKSTDKCTLEKNP